MNRRSHLWAVAGLFLLTIVVYWPALQNRFIWDDDDHLTQNPAMVAPDGLRRIWSSLAFSRYYPLTLTSFWLGRRVWGLNPMPYHVVNIILHAFSAGLLFLLLRRLNVRGAWVAAALWAVHPLNVETVAWITEMKNTQSGVFFFLSLLCYLQFERNSRCGWYALALLCFAAALASKPSTVTLPLVLLLVAWWQRRKCERRDLWRSAPFFALSAAMSLLTIAEQQRHIEGQGYEGTLMSGERLVVAGRALWFYARKLAWPLNPTFVYPRWDINASHLVEWLPLAGAVTVALILWRCRRQPWSRTCVFGMAYFVVALLPVLGFFDVYYFRFSFVADHFQYLAGVGLIALTVAGGTALLRRQNAQVALAGAAVAVLGVMSWGYCHVFHDDETLWRDALAKSPQSFMPHNNLGSMLFQRGQYEQAAWHFEKVVRLQPRIWQSHLTLANSLVKLGKFNEAIAHYKLALKISPQLYEAHYNLGIVYSTLGQNEQAITHLREALALKPDFADASHKLAALLTERGGFGEGVETLRRAWRANPKDWSIAGDLAWLLAACPDPIVRNGFEAARIAEDICRRCDNKQPDPMDTLAAAYAEAGCFEDAAATARKALALAQEQHNAELVAQIAARIELYERHEPYRLPPGP